MSTPSHRRTLLKLQKLGSRVRRVLVVSVIGPRTCLTCLQADGRVYELDVALRENPLPCRGCSCAALDRARSSREPRQCQCRYRAVWESYLAPLQPSREREAARARLKAEYITARWRDD